MMDAGTLANLVAYSAQIACIAAGGSLVPALLRIEAPAIRYLYWRALLALCVALPWLQGREAPASIASATAAVLGPAMPFAGAAGTDLAASGVAGVDWLAVAGMGLLGGTLLRLLWIGIGLARLRRLRSAGCAAPELDGHNELQRIIGTRAEIRYVPELEQPVTFGLLRPVVLLPDRLREEPPQIERAVLAHELLHVQRRDWGWVIAEELLRAVLWFHPAVWWLIARVQLAREEAVDELAVLATGTRRAYIDALLTFADATPLAPAPAFSRRRHLFRRIVLISRETAMSSRRVACSFFVIALAMAAGAWYTTRAFPLAAAGGGQELLTVAGAVESRARPITPENPIPRRIYSTSPQYPFEAAAVDAHGVVTLKVTLGESGRVAELRRAGFVGGSDRPPANVALELRGDPMGPVTEASIRRAKPLSHTTMPAGATQLAGAVEALFRAAADGVAQWQYDPPANGPISFYLQIAFRPGLDATLVAQDPVLSPARVALFLPAPRPPAGLIGDTRAGAPPPPTAPPPAPPPPSGVDRALAPIRVGRNIAPPVKTKDARPVYPAIARTAKVQGVVILELSVDADGRVSESRVIRSLPLLDQAALDAVRQWEFTPTLLNGVPTPIIMTVTVNFTLAESPDPAP